MAIKKLHIILICSILEVMKLLISNQRMHNFHAIFRKILEICKQFSYDLVNTEGNSRRRGVVPRFSDIEVIANATEVTSQMVTEQHLLRIVSVTSRSRAVNNEVFHLLFRHHLKSSHDIYTL